MRIALACLAVAASLACAQAGEISTDHRGTWTETGECQLKRRIVIGENTIKLVEPGRQHVLTDGDEAVFKGETLINASQPSKNEEEPVLAFSARVVNEDGDTKLVTEGLENGGFSGTFKLCKEPMKSAKAKNSPRRRDMSRSAPGYVYPQGTLLGGLY